MKKVTVLTVMLTLLIGGLYSEKAAEHQILPAITVKGDVNYTPSRDQLYFEDFTTGIPADWTQVQYSGTGLWTWEPNGTPGEFPNTDGIYIEADSDQYSTDVFDVGIFTGSFDFSGYALIALIYDRNFQEYADDGEAAIRTYSGGVLEEELWWQDVDDPYGGVHDTLTFNPSAYTHPDSVQIEFWYSTEGGTYAWYFKLDNVSLETLTVPDYEVSLSPTNPPVIIPPGGGSFDFNVTFTNNTDITQSFYAVLFATLPNGNQYGPINPTPAQLSLGAYGTLSVDLTQNVPGNAPTGVYTYYCLVGTGYSSIMDSSGFTFEKLLTNEIELQYDDGTYYNAWVFYDGDNIWYSHYFATVGSQITKITGFYWPDGWPDMTLENVRLQLWDDSGGYPGTQLWTEDVLPDDPNGMGGGWAESIVTPPIAIDDFYVVNWQIGDYGIDPLEGICMDDGEDYVQYQGYGTNDGSGNFTWTSTAGMGGDLMLRAWALLPSGRALQLSPGHTNWDVLYTDVGIPASAGDRWYVDGVVSEDGTPIIGNPEGVMRTGDAQLPGTFALHQNYPNPFNPTTTITYDVAKESDVRVDIYSLTGQLVYTLVTGGNHPAGSYSVNWNGTNYYGDIVPSGMYLYRVTASDADGTVNYTATKKLILMK